jgi:tetratricopeptide (TPR) repeat protein
VQAHLAALELSKQIGDPRGQAASFSALGATYRAQGKLPEALQSYQVALELYKQIGDPLEEDVIARRVKELTSTVGTPQ